MSGGYSYHPLIRITPTDGAAKVLDLRQEFSAARGPESIRVDYSLDADDYLDVNRNRRQNVFGIECDLRLTIPIVDTAEHATLAEIVTAFLGTSKVELSLDGGYTYREVNATRLPSPRPFRGKTHAGARHEIRLECVAPLTEQPAMTAEGGW